MNINHHDLGPTIGYSEEPESTQEDHDLSSKCAPYSLYSWERAPQLASSPSRPSESSENGVGDVPMANFGRPSRPHVGGPSKPKPKPKPKEQ
ncbi:uncharacterized protein STEHIDRAFT_119873 [Stereum hirsutum FP-91666 SS1]|uniref:uncharacterized protein n=1 Tax=Stereum hirsutum (strain FP-91666) TaxID=721885 RepID=UPI000440DD3D|nr:uncharacterized protein STEHIDRAFT_119873 [Stereum hirsutum FP-91666 SS1]EIM89128.1 hypothetical protein STEHIDRAFT_119873 [Stereum hirsutum FP-91666 SS1]